MKRPYVAGISIASSTDDIGTFHKLGSGQSCWIGIFAAKRFPLAAPTGFLGRIRAARLR
jgi:hypothetical protein